jgi:plastocyanin
LLFSSFWAYISFRIISGNAKLFNKGGFMSKRLCLILFLAIGMVLLAVLPALADVDTAWVRRYNGPGNSSDVANAIAVDDSGNIYVTGSSVGSGTYEDYATIKYYPNGDTAWVRRYNGPGDSTDVAQSIAVDDFGHVYLTGWSYGSGTYSDYATIKYYSNGDTAWVRRYNGSWNDWDEAVAIALDDSGCVYVTGLSWGGSANYLTIKYYSNGDTAWVRGYNWYQDYAHAMSVDGSGCVYVTGEALLQSPLDFYWLVTVKYHPNGETAWARMYVKCIYGETAVAVDDLGKVYVTGGGGGPWTDCDYITIKYYANGDIAWVKWYDGLEEGNDYASCIAVDSSGNIYVSGQSWRGETEYDYATIKYYPNGDTAWVRRYNGPENHWDWANAIAVDGSGNVYVTGRSEGSATLSYYATIKYDSSGNELWVEKYNGPGNGLDEACAITVDGSDNVYVTGYSFGNGTERDFATIKYVQGISYVSIIDFAIVPQADTITVGDSVRWTNNGAVLHTSTSDTKVLWDSGTLNPGESFTFQFNDLGSYPYHCEFHPSMVGTIVVISTDVRDEAGDREKPSEFALSQNYPNPFNQNTKIEFTLAKSGFVSLNVYDILGRKARTLVSEHLSSGYKSVLWDGKNDSGKDVASGIYFYQMRVKYPASGGVGDFSETRKLVLLK